MTPYENQQEATRIADPPVEVCVVSGEVNDKILGKTTEMEEYGEMTTAIVSVVTCGNHYTHIHRRVCTGSALRSIWSA